MKVRLDSAWFRRYGPVGALRWRLVCLPHAGGTASFFHRWAGAVDPSVELLVARYPGRQERIAEPCIEWMEPFADAVTEALLPFLDRPLVLFGHSMGASLAYEVALRLEGRYTYRPALLAVSSRRAPHRPAPRSLDPQDDRALIAEIRELGGMDGAILDDPDLRDLVLPAIRGDFTVVGNYGLRPPVAVGCPVAAYVGDQDPEISPAEMRFWADIAPVGFTQRVLSGGHFYLAGQEDVIAQDLATRIG